MTRTGQPKSLSCKKPVKNDDQTAIGCEKCEA